MNALLLHTVLMKLHVHTYDTKGWTTHRADLLCQRQHTRSNVTDSSVRLQIVMQYILNVSVVSRDNIATSLYLIMNIAGCLVKLHPRMKIEPCDDVSTASHHEVGI